MTIELPRDVCELIYAFAMELYVSDEIQRAETYYAHLRTCADRYYYQYNKLYHRLYTRLHGVLRGDLVHHFAETGGTMQPQYQALQRADHRFLRQLRFYVNTRHQRECERLADQLDSIHSPDARSCASLAYVRKCQDAFARRCEGLQLACELLPDAVRSRYLLLQYMVQYINNQVVSWPSWWRRTVTRSLPSHLVNLHNHFLGHSDAIQAFLRDDA